MLNYFDPEGTALLEVIRYALFAPAVALFYLGSLVVLAGLVLRYRVLRIGPIDWGRVLRR